jgi:indoleamine 2,3-dioxygenase
MKILQDTYTDGFFDVSASHGFLPTAPPLAVLPEPYGPLQELLDNMPVVKEDGTGGFLHYPGKIHAAAAKLPNFLEQVTAEKDIRVIQALYRAYAFLTSAFTLEPAFQHFRETGKYGKANNVLPANIAQPFVTVCNKLQVFPWLDYHYGYSLGNFKKIDPNGPLEWNNLAMCVRFSGQPDEAGFILLHVDINQFSPALVGSVMQAFRAAEQNDVQAVEQALDNNLDTLTRMNIRRKEMWKASRWQHYNDFRVFIMGIKGNEEIFGEGVTYTGVWDTPQQFRGQTGAQDDIIPMEDIFSGVTNFYPKNELTAYLLDLRKYRPEVVQQFFNDLEAQVKDIHAEGMSGYLYQHKSATGLSRLLGILEQIYHFRNGHWQFVQKYIMANTPYAKATGGTPITSWLPNQITAVLQQIDAVLALLDEMQEVPDEKGVRIIETNRTTLDHKKQLLADQLSEVSQETYSADTIFSLNTKYGLSDQE